MFLLVILCIIAAIACGIFGVVVKGLVWLFFVGIVLLVVAYILGYNRS